MSLKVTGFRHTECQSLSRAVSTIVLSCPMLPKQAKNKQSHSHNSYTADVCMESWTIPIVMSQSGCCASCPVSLYMRLNTKDTVPGRNMILCVTNDIWHHYEYKKKLITTSGVQLWCWIRVCELNLWLWDTIILWCILSIFTWDTTPMTQFLDVILYCVWQMTFYITMSIKRYS